MTDTPERQSEDASKNSRLNNVDAVNSIIDSRYQILMVVAATKLGLFYLYVHPSPRPTLPSSNYEIPVSTSGKADNFVAPDGALVALSTPGAFLGGHSSRAKASKRCVGAAFIAPALAERGLFEEFVGCATAPAALSAALICENAVHMLDKAMTIAVGSRTPTMC